MKSQVGLGRLYPDGRLNRAQDADQATEPSQDPADAAGPTAPSELLSVVVHIDKSALNELLQKSSQP